MSFGFDLFTRLLRPFATGSRRSAAHPTRRAGSRFSSPISSRRPEALAAHAPTRSDGRAALWRDRFAPSFQRGAARQPPDVGWERPVIRALRAPPWRPPLELPQPPRPQTPVDHVYETIDDLFAHAFNEPGQVSGQVSLSAYERPVRRQPQSTVSSRLLPGHDPVMSRRPAALTSPPCATSSSSRISRGRHADEAEAMKRDDALFRTLLNDAGFTVTAV